MTDENSITGVGTSFQLYMKEHHNSILLGIHNKWYDVTEFVKIHPGGSFIERLHGCDVTCEYTAFHSYDVLKGKKPVGTFDNSKNLHIKEYLKLHDKLKTLNFFETDFIWYSCQWIGTLFAFLLCLFISRQSAVLLNRHISTTPVTKIGLFISLFHFSSIWALKWVYITAVAGGICLGAVWQQCGFMMHDLMHNQLWKNRRRDQFWGTFFGTVIVGINSHWWRDEHFEHHAFTNIYDGLTGYYDPQMREEVWAQNERLFSFFQRATIIQRVAQYVAIKVQCITLFILCIGIGRIAIILDGFKQEKRRVEWIAISMHILLYAFLAFKVGHWQIFLIIYITASFYEGVLHIQLILSHYAKPWSSMEERLSSKSWPAIQITQNLNVSNPQYFDWFWGGLNFHIEHHLFPILPRNSLRRVAPIVAEYCETIGLKYDSRTFWQLLTYTTKMMYTVSKTFTFEDTKLKK